MHILTWKAVSGNQAAGRATFTRHVLKEELNKERYCSLQVFVKLTFSPWKNFIFLKPK
jgi:hypothetical protein